MEEGVIVKPGSKIGKDVVKAILFSMIVLDSGHVIQAGNLVIRKHGDGLLLRALPC